MGLSAGQQRILDGIDDWMQANDSRLAALFANFTRLTRQEQMPEVEQFGRGGALPGRRARRLGRPRRQSCGDAASRPEVSHDELPGDAERYFRPGPPEPWPAQQEMQGGAGGRVWPMALVPIAFIAVLCGLVITILLTAGPR